MRKSKPKVEWIEANQACLVAEFARLKEKLGSKPDEQPKTAAQVAQAVAKTRAQMTSPSALDRLVELFGLSEFEREILLLCAGVEMDSALAHQCSAMQGHPSLPYVTFGLAMAIVSEPHWTALTPSRPLRYFRLVELESGHSLTTAPLRIDERILHYLAGVNFLDPRLQFLLQPIPPPERIAADHEQVVEQAIRLLEAYPENAPVIHLCGDDSDGQEDAAALAAQNTGRQLFAVRVEDLPQVGPDLDQLTVLWQREAALLPGALLIQCASAGLSSSVRHLVERIRGPVSLTSRDTIRLNRPLARFEVNKPQAKEQKRLWQEALGASATALNCNLDDVSEQFRLSARMICSTASRMSLKKSEVSPESLWSACRSLARPKLENLAQRIVPSAGWDDLVLPESQKEVLRQLAAQVRHRMKVYETWGFSRKSLRGLGVSALFTGESGTGKTMAAEVLARELALDLYRIDLSAVVSKYIGETEKNLKQVFDAAEEGGVTLLFDEADALFGKRSEVKDSHDRYANIEVSYLLQRMEAYQGLAILTTNLKSALDKAFQRRLRFIVNFPFPDATLREDIWTKIFPATTPTRDLDCKKLAQLNVTGGSIHNIALNAAFLAARENVPVKMAHLLNAAKLETQKIERPISNAETKGWV